MRLAVHIPGHSSIGLVLRLDGHLLVCVLNSFASVNCFTFWSEMYVGLFFNSALTLFSGVACPLLVV